jgi:hypothetical protein
VSGLLVGRITRSKTNLTSTEKLILVILGEHVRADGGTAYPSVATIASHAEVHARTVKRVLRKLRAGGWIHVVAPGGRGGRRYTATQYDVLPASRGDTAVIPRIDGRRAGGDIGGQLGVTPVSPYPEVHPEVQIHKRNSSAAPLRVDEREQKQPAATGQVLTEATWRQIRRAVHASRLKTSPGVAVARRSAVVENATDLTDRTRKTLAEWAMTAAEADVRAQVDLILRGHSQKQPRKRRKSAHGAGNLPLVGATPRAACTHQPPCCDPRTHEQMLTAESLGDASVIAGVQRLNAKRAAEQAA